MSTAITKKELAILIELVTFIPHFKHDIFVYFTNLQVSFFKLNLYYFYWLNAQ